jgi:hypothetical protein
VVVVSEDVDVATVSYTILVAVAGTTSAEQAELRMTGEYCVRESGVGSGGGERF